MSYTSTNYENKLYECVGFCPKPPMSATQYFIKDQLGENYKQRVWLREERNRIDDLWDKMSNYEKKSFYDMHTENLARYQVDLKIYHDESDLFHEACKEIESERRKDQLKKIKLKMDELRNH